MKIVELKREIDTQFREVNDHFREVNDHFREVDDHFCEVDEHFREVDEHFREVDEHFREVDARFNEVNGRFAAVDARFDELELRLTAEHETTRRHMDVLIEQLKTEWRLGLDKITAVEQRLVSIVASNASDHTVFTAVLQQHELRISALETKNSPSEPHA